MASRTTSRAPHIIVSGGIATGKSTVATLLARRLDLALYLEEPRANPFLRPFYNDPRSWALRSQLWFALDTMQQHAEIASSGQGGVQDHSHYEAVEVFAKAQLGAELISRAEFDLLKRAAALGSRCLPPPTACVLLDAPVATQMQRIAERGRPYEVMIAPDYLESLQTLRKELFNRWNLCPVFRIDTSITDLRRGSELEGLARELAVSLAADRREL